MTAAELAQVALLALAAHVPVWAPVACVLLLGVVLGVVHLVWAVIEDLRA